jgi:hypothetical protein
MAFSDGKAEIEEYQKEDKTACIAVMTTEQARRLRENRR